MTTVLALLLAMVVPRVVPVWYEWDTIAVAPVPVPDVEQITLTKRNHHWWAKVNGRWIVYHRGAWWAYVDGMFGGPPEE